ncbi:MAG: deoxyhypusine synthase [Candidatus Diapherotrites archaeon]
MNPEITDYNAEKKGTGEEGGKGAVDLVSGMKNAGFQASNLARGAELCEEMIGDNDCTVFFGFTANLVASGLRGTIAELCRKKKVHAIVTTAGAIDHDVIKCFMPYEMGIFDVDDAELHKKGINRVGNIFIPNKGFEVFEENMQKWFAEIYTGGKKNNKITSPSAIAKFIGLKIGEEAGKAREGSFLYWCAKNEIPVFCPGITDGAIGLQMYFFREENKEFVCDVAADLKPLADMVLNAERTGAIVLGGGIAKHHIIGANILREGLDYAVYVTTAQEFDGSLSGAQTREAKSWGKLRERGKNVTVNCDATIAFPLIAGALRERGVL